MRRGCITARQGGQPASPDRTSIRTEWSGELLKLVDDLGIANDTIVFLTDNGPHYNTWPDAGTTPFRSEKNSNWEGAYRVPAFVHGKFPPVRSSTVSSRRKLDGHVSDRRRHATRRLMKGDNFAGRKYRAHPDGYNMLDYFSSKTKTSPRNEFWYVNDEGQVVAARCGLEGRVP